MRVRSLLCGAVLIVFGALAGCVERAPQTRSADSSRATSKDSVQKTVADTLPAGRFQLRFHTRGVPDLFISLPAGYTIKDVGKSGEDDLLMASVDDPSLGNSDALTPGYIRLRTMARGGLGLPPNARPDSADIIIAGRPVRWIRATMTEEGKPFHYARIESSDFFSALSPELAHSAPVLVVEVAGADSRRVDALVAAVESIRFVP